MYAAYIYLEICTKAIRRICVPSQWRIYIVRSYTHTHIAYNATDDIRRIERFFFHLFSLNITFNLI